MCKFDIRVGIISALISFFSVDILEKNRLCSGNKY